MATPLAGVPVLALDDEPDALEALCLYLEMQGANVTCVTSPKAALTLLPSLRPDVVLSDLSMPEMDGVAFIREVRNQGWVTPALAVSAFTDREWRNRALGAGFMGLLPKPVDLAVLAGEVARLARRSAG